MFRGQIFGKLAAVGAAAILSLGFSTANAVTMVIDNTSGNNQTDVEGTMVYSVSSNGGTSYTFAFSLENTSSLGTTRLTGVAFDFLGAYLSHTAPAGWGFEQDATLPGEALTFDACFYSGSNCGSGGNGGLSESDPALSGFSVTFNYGDGSLSAAAVEALFTSGFEAGTLAACVRVISIPTTGPGSGNGAGSDVACFRGTTGDDDDEDLPEPGTLALLGLGLLGVGLSRRRKI